MRIIQAIDVPCPICKVESGDKCVFMYGAGRRRERKFRFGSHAQRCRDADVVTTAAQMLLGEDPGRSVRY